MFSPYVTFEMARIRGEIKTIPELASEVSVRRNDDESDGMAQTHDARAPETMANEIDDRSAEMEASLRFGRIVQDSVRPADTRD